MAAEADIIRYMITGEEGEVIPQDATHFSVHPSVTVIPELLFEHHPNIIELICHEGVIKIETSAFYWCPSLLRVIIPGVKVVNYSAFQGCEALVYVECCKLEVIDCFAFYNCRSLPSITLPSATVVNDDAFSKCFALVEANFGKSLVSFGRGAFKYCYELEKITIPLRKGIISEDDTFQGCRSLKRVYIISPCNGSAKWLHEIWDEISYINQILPNAPAGKETYHGEGMFDEDMYFNYDEDGDDGEKAEGEKAQVIQNWIETVRDKLSEYVQENRRIVEEALAALESALPRDLVMNNVFPYIELPSRQLLEKGIKKRKKEGKPMRRLVKKVTNVPSSLKNAMKSMRKKKHDD